MMENELLYCQSIDRFGTLEATKGEFNFRSDGVEIKTDALERLIEQGQLQAEDFGPNENHRLVSWTKALAAISGIDTEHFWAVYSVYCNCANTAFASVHYPKIDAEAITTLWDFYNDIIFQCVVPFIFHFDDLPADLDADEPRTVMECMMALSSSSAWNCFCMYALLDETASDEQAAYEEQNFDDFD